jgi:phosphoenolpyruvate-protein phosphotransferase (PTS system enzyme I)
MEWHKGLIINPGVVLGKASIWVPTDEPAAPFDLFINQREVLTKALLHSTAELESAIASSNALYSDVVSVIFEAHKLMVNDPILLEDALAFIDSGYSAYESYRLAAQKVITHFMKLENEYMKNRIVDIEDATDRVLAAILDVQYEQALQFSEPRILILPKMKPSVLLNCHAPSVVGFVSAQGAYDQHSALIARTKDLPGLIVNDILTHVKDNDLVLLDADHGIVYLHPTEEAIQTIIKRKTGIK